MTSVTFAAVVQPRCFKRFFTAFFFIFSIFFVVVGMAVNEGFKMQLEQLEKELYGVCSVNFFDKSKRREKAAVHRVKQIGGDGAEDGEKENKENFSSAKKRGRKVAAENNRTVLAVLPPTTTQAQRQQQLQQKPKKPTNKATTSVKVTPTTIAKTGVFPENSTLSSPLPSFASSFPSSSFHLPPLNIHPPQPLIAQKKEGNHTSSYVTLPVLHFAQHENVTNTNTLTHSLAPSQTLPYSQPVPHSHSHSVSPPHSDTNIRVTIDTNTDTDDETDTDSDTDTCHQRLLRHTEWEQVAVEMLIMLKK